MKVVFSRSNPIAPDPRVEKEARVLKKYGAEVHVVAWDRDGVFPPEEDFQGIRIHRLSIRAGYARGLQNAPALLKWQAGLFLWLLRHREHFDIIHACDFDTVIPALLCKWICNKKVIYDIFDFYADYLRATPTIFKKVLRQVDFTVIGLVDAVILADDSRTKQIAGARPKVLEIVYNSPEDMMDSIQHCRSGLGQDRSFSIAYVGLLQIERGLFYLLRVLERHPEWHLDIAGFGGDEEELLSMARGMPNVTWHGRVAYSEAIRISACADVLIATYDPSIPNHRYASPNKIFEAMMLSKPIVVAQDTNMDRIIEENSCGVAVPYGDVAALEGALLHLANNPQVCDDLGKNGRRTYETKFSWEIMSRRLLNIYQTTTG